MKKTIELNTKFEDLEVIKYNGIINNNNTYICACSCGNNRIVKVTDLLRLKVTHCGCKNFTNKTHGNAKFTPTESSFRAKATNYKSLAKARNIEFLLTIEKTIELLKQNCFYCGKSPSNIYNVRLRNRAKNKYASNYSKEFEILYNGIDRVNNNEGYTLNNVVTCCTQCNTAKLNYSEKEFKEWIINIYTNYIINEYISNK